MLLHNIGFLVKRFAVTNSIFSKQRTKSDINQLVYILAPCTCAENWRNDTFTHKDFMSESVTEYELW